MKLRYLALIGFICLFTALTACQKSNSTSTAGLQSSTTNLPNAQQVKDCSFSKDDGWWKTSFDALPGDVAKNPVTGSPEFCEFYQFAQDWFLYLISPSATAGKQNWQTESQFPLLETSGTNSCDNKYPEHAFNVRVVEDTGPAGPFVLPTRINQADANAIYDQDGNVVFYEVRFSKNLCDYKTIQQHNDFPAKTVELKLSWKVLNKNEIASKEFYQTAATIAGKHYILGLIGWHIVVTAGNHPEMVWITLEHKNNSVACSNIGKSATAYSFTSSQCSQDKSQCQGLNKTIKLDALKLPPGKKPNDICLAYPYGTTEGQSIDTKDGLNIALIQKLNASMQTILSKSDIPAYMHVWKNYNFNGALWVSDIKQNSSVASNQRGSLNLANSVMETTFQGMPGNPPSPTVNCFACHHYQGTSSGKSNTLADSGESHIFDDIIKGQQ